MNVPQTTGMAPPIIKKSNSTNKLSSSAASYNRQSVSFSEDTFKTKEEENSVSNQRININQNEKGGALETLTRDVEAEYLDQAQMNMHSKHLMPYHPLSSLNSSSYLISNASIMSNNSNLSSSTNRIMSPNVSTRVQKSMTTGSKAMRIMGKFNVFLID